MDTIDVPAKRSPFAVAALNEGLTALQDVLRLPELETAAVLAGMNRWWRAYERYLAIVSSSVNARCSVGCAACCHQNPRGLTGVEALGVLQLARSRDDWKALRHRLRSRAKDWSAALSETGGALQAMAVVKRAKLRCAFLGEDDRCVVYEARPVACRMFYALTDPAWCDVQHPKNADAVNPHFEPAKVLIQLLAAISERSGLDGLPSDLWSAVCVLDDSLVPDSL